MKRRTTTLLLALALVFTLAPQLSFADTDPLTDKKTYYTEEEDYISGDCILTATRMMIRRAAIMNGKAGWNKITNEVLRQVATVDGCLLSSFTFKDEGTTYEVGYGEFKGEDDAARIGEFAKLVEEHPEGVVVHGDFAAESGMHGVLLTDVVDGVPYAMDASYNMGMFSEGIQKWSDTTMLEPSLCLRYWYIKDAEKGKNSVIDDCVSGDEIIALVDPSSITEVAHATLQGLQSGSFMFRLSKFGSIR